MNCVICVCISFLISGIIKIVLKELEIILIELKMWILTESNKFPPFQMCKVLSGGLEIYLC